jgi:hypothetical protein
MPMIPQTFPPYRLMTPEQQPRATAIPETRPEVGIPLDAYKWVADAMQAHPRAGYVPRGLLDQYPDVSPMMSNRFGRGLLAKPIIWDRVREGLLGTEGMHFPYGGGGRGVKTQMELPLQGGREISRNTTYRAPERPPVESKWKWEQEYEGAPQSVKTPSGVRVSVYPEANNSVDVLFHQPGPGATMTGRQQNPSTKRGIERFSDVFSAVKDYVSRFQPRELRFTAATSGHGRVYDRVAPLMAKELGGALHSTMSGEYIITLPEVGQ